MPEPACQTLPTGAALGCLLAEHATELLWQTNTAGLLIDLSPSWSRVTGYEPASLRGKVFSSLVHTDDLAALQGSFDKAVQVGATLQLPDYRIRHADGSWHWHAATLTVIGQDASAESGEAVFLVGVARDITEQRQAVELLRESDENYRLILENAQEAIIIAQDLHLVMVNPAAVRLTGFTAEHLMAGSFLDLMHPDDRDLVIDRQQRRQRGEEVPVRYSFRVVCLDGSFKWLEQHSSRTSWNGKPATLAVLSDITERRRAAQQLRLQAMVLDQIQDLVTITDLEGVITYVNEATARIHQRSKEALIGSFWTTCGVGLDHDATRKEIVAQTRKQGHWRGEIVNYDHQGRPLVLDCRTTLIHDADGQPIGICQIAVDITHRREAEEQVRQSETALKAILNASPEAIFLMEVNGTILAANASLCKRMQTSWESLVGSNVYNYISPALAAARRQHVQHVVETRQPLSFRDQRNGLITEHYLYPVQGKDGEIRQLAVFAMDITGRVQRENLLLARLRLSEAAAALSQDALLQKVLDEAEALTGSCIGFFHFLETDQQTLSLQAWSTNTLQSYCRAEGTGFHYSLDAAGVWVDCIHQRRPVIHNDYAALPHRKGLPAGHASVVRELVVPIFRGEEIVAVFGVGNKACAYDQGDVELVTTLGDMAWDIVLRKRAEEAMAASEANLQEAQRIARMGRWELDLTTKRLTWSVGIFSLFEIDRESFVPTYEAFLEFVHPEDRGSVDRTYWESVHGKKSYEFEHRLLMADGRIKWVNEIGRTEYDDGGHPVRSIGTVQDITRRKQMEAALHEQETQYRRFVDTAREGIWAMDSQRLTTYVNQHIAKMLGYTAEEMIGRPIEDFMFAEDLAGHFQRMAERRQGKGGNYEHRFRHKDGRTIWTIVSATALLDDQGRFQGSFAMFTDITERKQTEEHLTVALAEREVLLREVHHRVKNNLAAIIGLMDMQRGILDDPAERGVLAELSDRIRSMSLVHEKLYRAESLANIDFHDYIQALVSHLRTSFGSPRIQCEVDAKGVEMPLDLAVPCGMIINELITNALKYAFPQRCPSPGNKTCRIRVTAGCDHGAYTLTVADNGVGIPPGYDWTKAKTLGLLLVRMLGQHQLGGSFELDSSGGTRFSLTFTARKRKI